MKKLLLALFIVFWCFSTAMVFFVPAGAEPGIEKETVEPTAAADAAPVETEATPRPRATPLRDAAVIEIPEEEIPPTDPPKLATDKEIDLLARTIWGEAEGVKSRAEQAAVGWCVLNRADKSGSSITSVVLAPNQFYCRTWGEVPSEFVELAQDVVGRWEREHAGQTDVGRTLPADYLYFSGDGWRNHFTVTWQGSDFWDWSLPNPYPN